MCTRKNCVCGPNNPRWKGGTWINSKGYRMVWAPGHPACNCRNYAPEHRKVWYDHHGSLPPDGWDVHHKNTKQLDNRIENLEQKTDSEHGKENGAGGSHRRRFLKGYRLAKGMKQAKERGAKGGRAAARNRRRRDRAARKSSKPRRRRGQLRLAA